MRGITWAERPEGALRLGAPSLGLRPPSLSLQYPPLTTLQLNNIGRLELEAGDVMEVVLGVGTASG